VVHSWESQQWSSDVVRALSVDPVGPHVDDKQPVKLVGWEDKAQSRQAHVRFSALAPTCVTGNATQQREAKSLPPVNRQGVSLPAGAVDAAIVNLAEFSARGRYQ